MLKEDENAYLLAGFLVFIIAWAISETISSFHGAS